MRVDVVAVPLDRARIGKLGQDNLAAGVLAFVVREGAAADVDDLGAQAILGGVDAMAERIRLNGDLGRALDPEFRVLGK